MKLRHALTRRLPAILCSLVLMAGCTAAPETVQPTPEPAPAPTSEPVTVQPQPRSEHELKEILDKMSIEEKIGQVVMVSIENKEMDEDLMNWLSDYQIGNIILYGKNISDAPQASHLNQQLQETILSLTDIPALLAVDQEGGNISRIHKGATVFPSNMAVGAARPDDLYPSAWAMAQELKDMGFNMNLAPVMDVNSNPDNPVINIRSYGDDPDKVSEYGSLWIRGMQENGVIATAKHFPGHGDTDTDSHFDLPVSDKSVQQLMETELVPFRGAIHSGVSAILTSHILFPEIDSEYPATMSQKILTDLLRDEMGYTGVIVSDSLQMAAIRDHYGMETAAVQALNAGVDLLILGDGRTLKDTDPDLQTPVITALHEAVRNGSLSTEVLNRAVMNVLKLKNSYGLFETDPATYHAPYSQDLKNHQALAQEISDQAITLVSDEAGLLPLPTESNLFVSYPSGYDLEFGHSSFCDVAVDHLYGKPVTVHKNPTHAEIEEVLFRADNYDTAIVLVSDMEHNPNQRVMIDRLLEKEIPLIVICIDSPYDLRYLEDIDTVFVTYGYTPSSVLSAIALMNGTLTPQGIIPVEVR